jgi:hypothetical protein
MYLQLFGRVYVYLFARSHEGAVGAVPDEQRLAAGCDEDLAVVQVVTLHLLTVVQQLHLTVC